MSEMFIPDPENDPQEEMELTYRLQESMHTFEGSGTCTVPTRKFCYEHKVTDYHQECGLPESSVLHYSDRHNSECYCVGCSQ